MSLKDSFAQGSIYSVSKLLIIVLLHLMVIISGVVRVRSELETESDVNQVEDELITKITELLEDRSLGDSARILECSQLRLIAAKRGNSIILYFFCHTLAELVDLQDMQTSGKLANVVEMTFNEMLSSAQISNLRISLYDEDFSRCELEFCREYFSFSAE